MEGRILPGLIIHIIVFVTIWRSLVEAENGGVEKRVIFSDPFMHSQIMAGLKYG